MANVTDFLFGPPMFEFMIGVYITTEQSMLWYRRIWQYNC